MTAVAPEQSTRPLISPLDNTPTTVSLTQKAFAGRLGISPEEFADAVGVGRTLIYLALQRNEIPHRRIGRRYVIPLAALEHWFAEAFPNAS